MSFPAYSTNLSVPPAQGGDPGHQVPGKATATHQAPTSHQGMPPDGVTDGLATTYGYAHASAMDWQADMPELAPAWAAIRALADVEVLNSDFGAIDARNQLLTTFKIPRAVIDNMRGAANSQQAQQKTIDAVSAFAASANPDPSLLDGPNPPFDLLQVLAMIDRGNVSGCTAFLAPVMTLLVLRKAGAGDRYDKAVLARHSQAFVHLKQSFADAGDAQYAATQERRHEFLKGSAESQEIYRQLHPTHTPPATGHLPAPVQLALARLADAYRQDMGVLQKDEIVSTLERAFGVSTEASDDVSRTLEQLLMWYESSLRHIAPPPPALLMGLVMAVGWFDYQDEKYAREKRIVKHTLTGHPALPDALSAALLHYLPVQAKSLSLMGTEPPAAPQAGPGGPAALELRKLLAAGPQPGPRRLAQLIERAIALSGAPWIERIDGDHLAVSRMMAELTSGGVDAAQGETYAQALGALTDVMRQVVSTSDPLSRAFMLDLYRALGVAASESSRAARLNAVFFKHPEISAASAQQMTEQFAQRMVGHGYSKPQWDALLATVRQLRPHWNDCATTHLRVRQEHEKSLDAVLELQIAKASTKHVENAACLGVASAPQLLQSLITRHGFSDEMLGKLGRDLHHLQLYGSVATRTQMESRYGALLHPPLGSLAGNPTAGAIRRLYGAIAEHLAKKPSIAEEVSTAFTTLGGGTQPTAQLHQILRYFWRLDGSVPASSATASVRLRLEQIKDARCISAGGEIDISKVCEFNNASREAIVRTLTERVPGFGVHYANALESTTGMDYQAVMSTMQAALDSWKMPESSY